MTDRIEFIETITERLEEGHDDLDAVDWVAYGGREYVPSRDGNPLFPTDESEYGQAFWDRYEGIISEELDYLSDEDVVELWIGMGAPDPEFMESTIRDSILSACIEEFTGDNADAFSRECLEEWDKNLGDATIEPGDVYYVTPGGRAYLDDYAVEGAYDARIGTDGRVLHDEFTRPVILPGEDTPVRDGRVLPLFEGRSLAEIFKETGPGRYLLMELSGRDFDWILAGE